MGLTQHREWFYEYREKDSGCALQTAYGYIQVVEQLTDNVSFPLEMKANSLKINSMLPAATLFAVIHYNIVTESFNVTEYIISLV